MEEKIASLFIVGVHSRTCNTPVSGLLDNAYEEQEIRNAKMLITHYHVGGIIFLGMRDLEEQLNLTREFQEINRDSRLLIAEDLEWGLTMRIRDGLRFPRNMTLGAIQDDSLIYCLGREIGRQCRVIGVHFNLAPVVDVNNNPANPVINDRSFGEDQENVARKGLAYAKGLQDAGIIACAKHFPGHGGHGCRFSYRVANNPAFAGKVESYRIISLQEIDRGRSDGHYGWASFCSSFR